MTEQQLRQELITKKLEESVRYTTLLHKIDSTECDEPNYHKFTRLKERLELTIEVKVKGLSFPQVCNQLLPY